MAPAVSRETALHVGEEFLPLCQRPVPRENGIGRSGRELAAAIGITGLEDHRATLRAAWHAEPATDVEMTVMVGEFTGGSVGQEHAARLVGDDLVTAPRVEQRVRCRQEALGPLVALVFRQKAAAPKVLSGERIPRRDDIPRRASL